VKDKLIITKSKVLNNTQGSLIVKRDRKRAAPILLKNEETIFKKEMFIVIIAIF